MTKCWYCEEEAKAQCKECGAFFCKEHGDWTEEQYDKGKWRRRMYCKDCTEFRERFSGSVG